MAIMANIASYGFYSNKIEKINMVIETAHAHTMVAMKNLVSNWNLKLIFSRIVQHVPLYGSQNFSIRHFVYVDSIVCSFLPFIVPIAQNFKYLKFLY